MSAPTEHPTTVHRTPVAWPPVLGAMVLILVVGLVDLGGHSLWSDEADTWYVTSEGWAHLVDTVAAWDLHAAAYYALVWLSSPLGETEWWLRLPSVLFAVATVPLVALLATRWFGRWVGVVAALVVAAHGFFVPYAQEARSYTMAVALVAAAGVLLDLGCERRTTRVWIGWSAVTGLLFVTHLFGALVAVVALAVALLFDRSPLEARAARWSVVGVGVFGAVVTFGVFAQHAETPFDYIGGPWEPSTYFDLLRDLSGGGRLALAVVAIPATAFVVDVARRVAAGDRGEVAVAQLRVLVTILGTIALSMGVSATGDDSYLLGRYLLPVLPYVAMAIARGAQTLPGRWVGTGVIVAFVVVSGLRWVHHWRSPSQQDFRSLTADWIATADPDDAVAFLSPYNRLGVAYYVRDLDPSSLPTSILPEDPWPVAWDGSYEVDADEVLGRLGPGQVLWLVANVGEGNDPDPDPRFDVPGVIDRLEDTLGTPNVTEYSGLLLYRFDR